jgi:hypothetical protein
MRIGKTPAKQKAEGTKQKCLKRLLTARQPIGAALRASANGAPQITMRMTESSHARNVIDFKELNVMF